MSEFATSESLPEILIVDDIVENLSLLDAMLTEQGYQVRKVNSGRMALKTINYRLPALILLDIKMPQMNGYEICQKLKADPTTNAIPIIFISALDEPIDKVKAFEVGGVDYITKPFQEEEVLARIANQLSILVAQAEIQQLTIALEQRVQQRTAELKTANQELHYVNQELGKKEAQFRLTFELAPIGMALLNLEGQFLQVNRALCNLLEYTDRDLLQLTWMEIIHPDDLLQVRNLQRKLLTRESNYYQTDQRYLTRSGAIIHSVLSVALMPGDGPEPPGLLIQLLDITRRKEAEEKLTHDALHDALTGLPNRTLFNERVNAALRRLSRQSQYLFAVLFIDLDRFKNVNDSIGHHVGDQLLIALTETLQDSIRATDTVARLGGDEFTVLLDDLQNINQATRVAERINEKLRSAFWLEGHQVFTNASIGVAMSSANYSSAEEMLRDADIAMYRAKERGRGRYEIFDQQMHQQVLKSATLETELRQAIPNAEFQLYYQPIISLQKNTLLGFEALVRWQHARRGIVSPLEFIPLAEETGLIIPLGQWILYEACSQLSQWQQKYTRASSLKMSVNLSARQLRDDSFSSQLDRVLAETGIAGGQLKLEITETAFMDNAEAVTEVLQTCQQKGIELCLDDFGVGYSSLSYLRRFPINTLKIDRSFVWQMDANPGDAEIVQAIINLARGLNMNVVAEGIETEQQVLQLQQYNCAQGQGYYFSKPLPADQAETLLQQNLIFA